MFGRHSISYDKLESYFYVFGVREGDLWLSWDEVKLYAEMFDFPTVPEIKVDKPLKEVFNHEQTENEILEKWLCVNLGITWAESVETEGKLGGFYTITGEKCSEGFVIRNSASFKTNEGCISVANNEFNNLFKIVRKSHVKSDLHWTKSWKPAKLINYSKYKWFGYEYLDNVLRLPPFRRM